MNLLRRIVRASLGLVLFGFGVYLTIQANIGLAPWDVFSMGVSRHFPVSFGTASVIVSLIIVAVDLALKEKIGIGTLLDAVLVGKSVDLFLWLEVVPKQHSLLAGIGVMLIGLFIMSFSQYLYMSAALCCGPRDTMLVGVGKRVRAVPIGLVNICILVLVLGVGVLLGGQAGIGTLVSAVGIGFTVEITFRALRFEPRDVAHQGLALRLPVGKCEKG